MSVSETKGIAESVASASPLGGDPEGLVGKEGEKEKGGRKR